MDRTASIEIHSLLKAARIEGELITGFRATQRRRLPIASGEAILDDFTEGGARCLFFRTTHPGDIQLSLRGAYRMTTAQAGGWMLLARDDRQPSYWLPTRPTRRRIDDQGRIFEENACPIHALEVGDAGISVGLSPLEGSVLDLVIWEIDPAERELCSALGRTDIAERHPVFLWGSHGTYRIPADLYRHLVQGSVFDLRFSWPHKRRSYSENEAHGLHLTLRNREKSSGKSLYRHMRDQVLLSVLARQESDGAWRQGIWTDHMECHFRLHCSALHLLMDQYCEQPDDTVLAALQAGTRFISAQATEVLGETWFLHDSLEQSEQAIRENIPGWRRCTSAIKDPANTLVLNTHVDTLLALHRFQSLTGDMAYDQQIDRARQLLGQLLRRKPADTLYKIVFRALSLTLLPTGRARALPLPIRAMKRVARDHLIPLLPSIKCRYPRFVMPGGYLDRAVSLESLADSYHSINLMDLVRYLKRFPGEQPVLEAIAGALAFANKHDLIAHWAETPASRYAIGFWLEALYGLCLQSRDWQYREELATTLLTAAKSGLGLPPSLAGHNCEAIPIDDQIDCPKPREKTLWLVNLSTTQYWETLLVNPGSNARSANMDGIAQPKPLRWTPSWSPSHPTHTPPMLPPNAWVRVSRA